jgi:hypothetical protein
MVGSSCAGTLSRPTKKAWARNRSVGIPSQIADGWAPTLKRLRTGKKGSNSSRIRTTEPLRRKQALLFTGFLPPFPPNLGYIFLTAESSIDLEFRG